MTMFQKKEEKLSRIETIIGPQAILKGTIAPKGTIRVDGQIEGGILDAEAVILGDNGIIKGDVSAEVVIVGGKIMGNIVATIRLEILPKANVFGDIRTPSLSISDGSVFEGNCTMLKKNVKSENLELQQVNDDRNEKLAHKREVK